MSPHVPYHFILDLSGSDGAALGRSPADVDWAPALSWVHFQGIRDGRLPAVTVAPPARVDPVWHEASGPPRISGVRITMEGADDTPVLVELPLAYFGEAARDASAAHVEAGRLQTGATFTYTVNAYPGTPAAGSENDGLIIEPIAEPIVLTAGSQATLEARAVALGAHDAADLPVFVPAAVIAQTRQAVRKAGDVETGGVLLGHLRRDDDGLGLHAEVTAQVPARDAPSHATGITFTPATWTAARAALELRGRGETIRGWWHSHPFWCRECPRERREQCPLSGIFFSAQDCALHRTVFPQADQVALLLSDRDGGIAPSLFGWRRGRIVSRGWHLLDAPVDAPAPEPVPHATVGGDEHAQE